MCFCLGCLLVVGDFIWRVEFGGFGLWVFYSREKMFCGFFFLDGGFFCFGEEEFLLRRGCGRFGFFCLGCGK